MNVEIAFLSCLRYSFPPEHPERPALLTVEPQASVHTEPSDTSAILHPNTGVDPPSVQPQSSTTGATTADCVNLNQPIRQRLGEDLFRLVQVRANWPKGTSWTKRLALM